MYTITLFILEYQRMLLHYGSHVELSRVQALILWTPHQWTFVHSSAYHAFSNLYLNTHNNDHSKYCGQVYIMNCHVQLYSVVHNIQHRARK